MNLYLQLLLLSAGVSLFLLACGAVFYRLRRRQEKLLAYREKLLKTGPIPIPPVVEFRQTGRTLKTQKQLVDHLIQKEMLDELQFTRWSFLLNKLRRRKHNDL